MTEFEEMKTFFNKLGIDYFENSKTSLVIKRTDGYKWFYIFFIFNEFGSYQETDIETYDCNNRF
jgi:hypothetical protein